MQQIGSDPRDSRRRTDIADRSQLTQSGHPMVLRHGYSQVEERLSHGGDAFGRYRHADVTDTEDDRDRQIMRASAGSVQFCTLCVGGGFWLSDALIELDMRMPVAGAAPQILRSERMLARR